MHHSTVVEDISPSLRRRVEENVGETVNLCYQCGKCAAGCPLSDELDLTPNQILRMLQLDMPQFEDQILGSYSIWLCLTCETCSSRCPKNVEITKIMDFLRHEAIKENKVNPKAADILAFHHSFLRSVKMSGRLHEVSLIAGYKIKTMHLMQDVNTAPTLFFNGKLSILPHKVTNTKAIRRIFDKSDKMGDDL